MTGPESPHAVSTPPAAPRPARVGELLRLHPGARIVSGPGGATRILVGWRGSSLGVLSPGQAAAVALLAAGRAGEDELLDAFRTHEGESGMLKMPGLLRRLRSGGWLSVTLEAAGVPLLTFRPLGPAVAPVLRHDGDPAGLRLSRFAVLRADVTGMVLESPLAHVAAELHDPALAGLLAALPGRREAGDDTGAPQDVRHFAADRCEAVPSVLSALARHGFLVPRGGAAEESFRFAQWSPHELWFHSRTRAGRHDLPYGGTYWAEGVAEPLPPVRQPFGGPSVELPRADLRALRENDPTLTEVLEDRRSLRLHDDSAPLTVERLGEFLYRSARNRGRYDGGSEGLGDRPYPSGGRAYELEVYPLVRHVAGVKPGLYHYDPEGHRLELVAVPGPALDRLAESSRATARMSSPPQMTLLITARFGRVMWKYSSMGYALVLKHVGVLYQVMYSIATAMGLAGCGLGGGDSDAFALASGLSWESESTVGEFLLGSRAEEGSDGIPA
ncbi:SagB family peptide dehydrogenase [Streptomyces sp. SL13]|uniref:SagB family peptide dehydrogenase n=1 Tax=Streptantibioticus silvisoli TaxID=2705255 RepID=A0AA90HEM8_9ACTN|nr:SagB family peptide dehydrogenase [Streptantibioticus silvisoli]MDI5973537.1 SagB family peptide dehydrogenase [Streptantibioticus silvisoli]